MVDSDVDDDASAASVKQYRKEKWKLHGELEEEDDEEDRCMGCFELGEKVEELKYMLHAEQRAADETIIMVQGMERDHQKALDLATAKLNMEKDRVDKLQTTLDFERKARMQEMYKVERHSLEHENSMREFKNLNEKNSNLGEEFEAVQNQNATLLKLTEQLQENKQDILDQLKIYENEITELEKKNNDLRKRLYDSDNEKDRHKVLAARLKQKLHDYMNGRGDRARSRVGSAKNKKLGPLQSFNERTAKKTNYFSRAPGDSIFAPGGGKDMAHLLTQPQQQQQQVLSQASLQGNGGRGKRVDAEASLMSSMFADTRLTSSQTASELSSVNYIRSFNADPRTVSNSKKKNPMLWPVQY